MKIQIEGAPQEIAGLIHELQNQKECNKPNEHICETKGVFEGGNVVSDGFVCGSPVKFNNGTG